MAREESRRRGELWWRAASKEAGRARAREVRAVLAWERAGGSGVVGRCGEAGARRRASLRRQDGGGAG